ncbi:hypothetical protein [Aminobacter sp. BE322]|uniref:hypothetical protein n=1 Tax=unclassified Aminobacter TaxID=2644704 RepID=UPI003D24794E
MSRESHRHHRLSSANRRCRIEITPPDASDLGASYSYVDNRTVLVDPGTRKIVQIIE